MAIAYAIALWRGTPLHRAFPVYAILWLIASAVNLWIGVTRAGYPLIDELPIFALVFGVPCLLAWLLARRSA